MFTKRKTKVKRHVNVSLAGFNVNFESRKKDDFLFNLSWLFVSQTKSPFIEKNPSATECVNAGLKGKRPGKEYTSPSAKKTVSLRAHNATRDQGRLGSAGVWIEKENRSQEQELRERDRNADLRQVSRLVWYVIVHKQGRAFHQGFQTRENSWKHEAEVRVILLFWSVWRPRWNTKHEFISLANVHSCYRVLWKEFYFFKTSAF